MEANAFDYLRDRSEEPPTWDMVVLDPPAFAKNKEALPAARRGYKEINLRALQILKPGGILITASLIGLIVGLGVIVLFKRGRDYELPFGSFLALASILFLFRFSWLEHFFSKWTNLAP